jgi:hypothetical protein
MSHKHTWELAYRSTHNGIKEDRYHCPKCNEFETRPATDKQTRASNMGGDFSTNWSNK